MENQNSPTPERLKEFHTIITKTSDECMQLIFNEIVNLKLEGIDKWLFSARVINILSARQYGLTFELKMANPELDYKTSEPETKNCQ